MTGSLAMATEREEGKGSSGLDLILRALVGETMSLPASIGRRWVELAREGGEQDRRIAP